MVSCGKVFVLVTAMLCAVLGYYLYVPLPSDATEPWTMRMFCASMHMIRDLSKAGELIGLGSALNNTRAIQNWLVLATRPAATDNLRVTDTEFVGVKVRIYQPAREQKNLPGLVFYHGGGFMMGSIETHDSFTRALARELNMVVVSVEYRLAPEHPYPVPFEDCEKATAYFMKAAGQYGVDPARIGLAGDSAGGNLAAAVSLKLRDTPGAPRPKLQLLIYPALQFNDFKLPAHHQNDWHIWNLLKVRSLVSLFLTYTGFDQKYTDSLLANNHTTAAMKKKYNEYLGIRQIPKRFIPRDYILRVKNFGDEKLAARMSGKFLDPYVAPLLAESLKNVPPAYILTAEYDTLRDDGILYKRRLEDSQVKVAWDHYEDGWHGMITFHEGPVTSAVARRAFRSIVQYLKKYLVGA